MIEEMTAGEVEDFLRAQVVGRIGCHVDGLTYVVPVIFAWEAPAVHVYTTEGQKVEMMRANPSVCFEVDEYRPGGGWRSVIVQGTYEELDEEGAARTLALLAARLAPPSGSRRATDDRGGGRMPVALRIRAGTTTGRKVDRAAS